MNNRVCRTSELLNYMVENIENPNLSKVLKLIIALQATFPAKSPTARFFVSTTFQIRLLQQREMLSPELLALLVTPLIYERYGDPSKLRIKLSNVAIHRNGPMTTKKLALGD